MMRAFYLLKNRLQNQKQDKGMPLEFGLDVNGTFHGQRHVLKLSFGRHLRGIT
jgi:hypothetical protein